MPSSCAVSTVQVKPFFDEAAPLSGEQMMAANPYRPWPARITSIIDLTETEKLFEFRLIDERIRDAFSHEPGQFVEVSIFGVPLKSTVSLCNKRRQTWVNSAEAS